MKDMNIDYATGILDCMGSFTFLRTTKKKYIHFLINGGKISPKKIELLDALMEFLKKNYQIEYGKFTNANGATYNICKYTSLIGIVKFIEDNCHVKAYKNFDEVKKELNYDNYINKITITPDVEAPKATGSLASDDDMKKDETKTYSSVNIDDMKTL